MSDADDSTRFSIRALSALFGPQAVTLNTLIVRRSPISLAIIFYFFSSYLYKKKRMS